MPSTTSSLQRSDQKIELILILQAHPIANQDYDRVNMEIVYSQLKIMQMIKKAYSHMTVLAEGVYNDISSSQRICEEELEFLKEMFPDQDFYNIEFTNLNPSQQRLLNKVEGVYFLFQLGIIPCIYQAAQVVSDRAKLMPHYKATYTETLKQFPILLKKGGGSNIRLCNLDTLEDLKKYQQLEHIVRKKNPALFLNREKEALESVLRAAKKSKTNQVVLIFGKNHFSGFIELINTTFKNHISLKECIDTTAGFPSHDNVKKLQLENKARKEAIISFFKTLKMPNAIMQLTAEYCKENELQTSRRFST